jgi:hypothetical protein
LLAATTTKDGHRVRHTDTLSGERAMKIIHTGDWQFAECDDDVPRDKTGSTGRAACFNGQDENTG